MTVVLVLLEWEGLLVFGQLRVLRRYVIGCVTRVCDRLYQ